MNETKRIAKRGLCIYRECNKCGAKYFASFTRLKRGWDLFCSKTCANRVRASKKRVDTYLNPKKQARNAVALALKRGDISRPENCSECGGVGEIHGHHGDYSKPLNVVWLCELCHMRLHFKKR